MKLKRFLLAALLSYNVSFAAGENLVIAVDNYAPPFVLRGANNQLFGFDINMMETICKTMQRTCLYKPVAFNNLLTAVENKQAELALGALTITTDRAKLVNFSLPYMESKALFLGRNAPETQDIDTNNLSDKTIGVVQDTVYQQVLASMGVPPDNIKIYPDLSSLVLGLQNNEVDLVLTDEPTAEYWNIHSSGLLVKVGKGFSYGFGLGIAVEKTNIVLLDQLNAALQLYLNSPEYKKDYLMYFERF